MSVQECVSCDNDVVTCEVQTLEHMMEEKFIWEEGGEDKKERERERDRERKLVRKVNIQATIL